MRKSDWTSAQWPDPPRLTSRPAAGSASSMLLVPSPRRTGHADAEFLRSSSYSPSPLASKVRPRRQGSLDRQLQAKVADGDKQAVAQLLLHGARADATSGSSDTALHVAARLNQCAGGLFTAATAQWSPGRDTRMYLSLTAGC